MTYTLPRKIDTIISEHEEKIRALVASHGTKSGCPLRGTYTVYCGTSYAHLDEADCLEMVIGGLSGWGRPYYIDVPGCIALRDPCCYLDPPGRTARHPQVASKEECPVYRHVVRLLSLLAASNSWPLKYGFGGKTRIPT